MWIPYLPPLGKDGGQRESEPRERKRASARAPRQPNHFWFLDVRRDETGERREWIRADASTWEERWASGAMMRYRVVGRSSEIGLAGVIVQRVPDGLIEVLVPDVGPEVWAKIRVVPNGDWHPLGLIHPIE